MKKVLSVVGLSLLLAACVVPHDEDKPVVEMFEESHLEPVPPKRVVVKVKQPVQPVVQEVAVQPVVQPVVVQQPAKQKWWANRPKEVRVAPTCPCEDPNDPCTQCYDK